MVQVDGHAADEKFQLLFFAQCSDCLLALDAWLPGRFPPKVNARFRTAYVFATEPLVGMSRPTFAAVKYTQGSRTVALV